MASFWLILDMSDEVVPVRSGNATSWPCRRRWWMIGVTEQQCPVHSVVLEAFHLASRSPLLRQQGGSGTWPHRLHLLQHHSLIQSATLSGSMKFVWRRFRFCMEASRTRSFWLRTLTALATSLLLLALICVRTQLPSSSSSSQTALVVPPEPATADIDYEFNDYGPNRNLKLNRTRQKGDSRLKTILMWNEAYGAKTYDIGYGREPFYKYKCPETRCYSTSDRNFLPDVSQFDAIIFHQRSFDANDLPAKRSWKQRYIHWIMESAQYIYMDISQLNGIFNWTMTYRRDSDFYLPYGRLMQIKPHPTDKQELRKLIQEFGRTHRHLAANRTEVSAAWFVSHCATQSRRERFAKALSRFMKVDIYGSCSPTKLSCPRTDEQACYEMMQQKYRFYLSFENSICRDYVTEKYFNALKYNVVPLVYSGTDMEEWGAPPHTSINVFDFESADKLADYLAKLTADDALYAEYFWWKDYYVIRDQVADRAQAYCDLCAKLNNPDEPSKVYGNMQKWWVTDSKCHKAPESLFGTSG